jgi:RNA polymerase sigma-70 factor, ECF subfamily
MFEDDLIAETAAVGVSTAPRHRFRLDASTPSPLEEEVVSLFDQLQDRLQRYLFSLGMPATDCEEIIQEVFLALFQHLRDGKPRHNLRGWVFQVAHNWALKQRNVTRRNRQALWEYGGTSAENFFVDRAPNPEDHLAGNHGMCDCSVFYRPCPNRTGGA